MSAALKINLGTLGETDADWIPQITAEWNMLNDQRNEILNSEGPFYPPIESIFNEEQINTAIMSGVGLPPIQPVSKAEYLKILGLDTLPPLDQTIAAERWYLQTHGQHSWIGWTPESWAEWEAYRHAVFNGSLFRNFVITSVLAIAGAAFFAPAAGAAAGAGSAGAEIGSGVVAAGSTAAPVIETVVTTASSLVPSVTAAVGTALATEAAGVIGSQTSTVSPPLEEVVTTAAPIVAPTTAEIAAAAASTTAAAVAAAEPVPEMSTPLTTDIQPFEPAPSETVVTTASALPAAPTTSAIASTAAEAAAQYLAYSTEAPAEEVVVESQSIPQSSNPTASEAAAAAALLASSGGVETVTTTAQSLPEESSSSLNSNLLDAAAILGAGLLMPGASSGAPGTGGDVSSSSPSNDSPTGTESPGNPSWLDLLKKIGVDGLKNLLNQLAKYYLGRDLTPGEQGRYNDYFACLQRGGIDCVQPKLDDGRTLTPSGVASDNQWLIYLLLAIALGVVFAGRKKRKNARRKKQ